MALDYARACRDPASFVRDSYAERLAAGGSVYLYGAGNVGRKMLAALRAEGRKVAGFIDNNPALQGGSVEGAPVWRFEDLKPTAVDVCVVSIWNYRHDFRKSADHARALGFGTVMHFSALATLGDYEGVFPNYAVDHPARVFTSTFDEDYAAVRASFADEESRRLADQVLDFYALPTPENLPRPSTRALPFQPEVIKTYVDCGAFVGDDFAGHRTAYSGLETAYLIEPDPATFETLSKRRFEGLNAIPVHAAASDREGVVRFAASGSWGSHIADGDSAGANVDVRALTLDSLPLAQATDIYVKMDVEGHELAVLEGALGLLAGSNAVFGVTLEHKARDLFDIPRFLARFPHRRNWLFAHDTEFAMDLVVYSVPEPGL